MKGIFKRLSHTIITIIMLSLLVFSIVSFPILWLLTGKPISEITDYSFDIIDKSREYFL
jgi:hypothetical protein